MEIIWRYYGDNMELLWSYYGVIMELLGQYPVCRNSQRSRDKQMSYYLPINSLLPPYYLPKNKQQ